MRSAFEREGLQQAEGHKVKARKRFGQNFLNNQAIIDQLIQSINPKPSQSLVEIGPGLGALTEPLLSILPKLTVIEIDRDLITRLQAQYPEDRLQIIGQDALSVDFATLDVPKPMRIIGNLPYNISTPLLFHLLHYADQIEDMHFMLQKEVVDRIVAKPNTKAYGRLSVMFQYVCKADALFIVPPSAFNPQPKVQSQIVRLTPYKLGESPYPQVDIERFSSLVKQAFMHRRKTLQNNLKGLLSAEQISVTGLVPQSRPEACSLDHLLRLTQQLC